MIQHFLDYWVFYWILSSVITTGVFIFCECVKNGYVTLGEFITMTIVGSIPALNLFLTILAFIDLSDHFKVFNVVVFGKRRY